MGKFNTFFSTEFNKKNISQNKFAQKLCCRATKVDEKGMNVEKKQ